MDANGEFVVTWTSYGEDGSGNGVFARRFTPKARRGQRVPVNTYTANNQHKLRRQHGRQRRLRGRLAKLRPGRQHVGSVSASGSLPPGRSRRRVRHQHLHARQADEPDGGHGRQRRFRGRLAKLRSGRQRLRHLRPPLQRGRGVAEDSTEFLVNQSDALRGRSRPTSAWPPTAISWSPGRPRAGQHGHHHRQSHQGLRDLRPHVQCQRFRNRAGRVPHQCRHAGQSGDAGDRRKMRRAITWWPGPARASNQRAPRRRHGNLLSTDRSARHAAAPVPQTFAVTGPASGTYPRADAVTIQWTAGGVVAGSTISLCYDTDSHLQRQRAWIEIDGVAAANGSGTYTWNTTGVRAGHVLHRRLHVRRQRDLHHVASRARRSPSPPRRPSRSC